MTRYPADKIDRRRERERDARGIDALHNEPTPIYLDAEIRPMTLHNLHPDDFGNGIERNS